MSQDLDLSPWHEWPEIYDELERRHHAEARPQTSERPGDEAGAHVVQEASRSSRDS